MNWVLGCVIGVGLGLGAASDARACAFHGYTPDPTLVDLLLMTEQVVAARLSGADPGRYSPVETLMGIAVSDIDIPVSPAMRKRLAANPAATVLLARDGAYGPWTEVAVMEGGFRPLVGQILQRQSAWALGGDQDRLRLFSALVNDPNPDIRQLALKELDRASYGTLRDARLPRVRGLRQDLEKGERDLMPIRVLLAGLSQDRGFIPFLTAELDAAIARDLPYTGAYATALIELGGQDAVRDLLARHMRAGNLPGAADERLLEALAIQYKSGPRRLRRYIGTEVATLVRDRPDLAQAAARQFGVRPRDAAGSAAVGVATDDGGPSR